LHLDGQLRGCIGTLAATESIVEGVKRNALNAALHDHRFSPVKPEELDSIVIEVSVLTDPTPVEYTDGADLLTKLNPGVDGVIIRQGAARATFLPQVWDQLSGPEEFLTHLCLKAGLAGDAWQTSKVEVLIYQVQYFEEKK
jgi:AmmeMemoRadiSam system protein A